MTGFPFLFWLGLAFSPFAFAQHLFQKIPPNVKQGIEAYQTERFEDAHSAFEEAKTQMPSNAQLEFNQGTTYYKQGQYDNALNALNRARELDNGKLRGDIFYNMGNTYAAMGNIADAIASYRQALRLNPQDTMARQNMEFLLHQPPAPPQDKLQNNPKNNDDPEGKNPSEPLDLEPEKNPSSPQKPQDNKTTSTPSEHETGGHENTESQENVSPTPQNTTPDNNSPMKNPSGAETADRNRQENSLPQQREKRLRKEDADRILDAFGMDEKSYEPWRLQKKPPAEGWQYEQDW
ncbi:MAG: tetratricopeptide repeat protein [Cystobacterineae bacterium]|nr:tetratricopeptide repeat protein [Cystobacterineae bacterium]